MVTKNEKEEFVIKLSRRSGQFLYILLCEIAHRMRPEARMVRGVESEFHLYCSKAQFQEFWNTVNQAKDFLEVERVKVISSALRSVGIEPSLALRKTITVVRSRVFRENRNLKGSGHGRKK